MRLFNRGKQPGYVLLPFDLVSRVKARSEASTQDSSTEVIVPTDLMFAAWRQVFPAERMLIFGGRANSNHVTVSSLVDVTEPRPSPVHVRADAVRMANGLIDFERTGAHLAIWMHSHPGRGALATFPSSTDRQQELQWREHYSRTLINIIVVNDGYVRVWGRAVEEGVATIRWQGNGIDAVNGEPNVYQLKLA